MNETISITVTMDQQGNIGLKSNCPIPAMVIGLLELGKLAFIRHAEEEGAKKVMVPPPGMSSALRG